jgi:hypothetical protein
MFPRRGVIEVELLRRYGRTPAGSLAVGWFEVAEAPDSSFFTHVYDLRIQIADDPRTIGGKLYFIWKPRRLDEPYTRDVFHRGTRSVVTAADIFEYVVQGVVRYIEGLDTSAKHQRFRVVRAVWQDRVSPDGHDAPASAEQRAAADGGRDAGSS